MDIKEKLKAVIEQLTAYFKKNTRKNVRNILFLTLVVIIGIITVTTIILTFDIKTDFRDLNPPDQTHQKVIHIDYPSLGPSNSLLAVDKKVVNMPLLSVDIVLQYMGILAEGTIVDVGAVGYVYPEGQNIIARGNWTLDPNSNDFYDYGIGIGFEGATSKNITEGVVYPNGQFALSLNRSNDPFNISVPKRILPATEIKRTVIWETPGDYSPFIVVGFRNGTVITTDYPDSKIHISSSDIVRQEKYSKINTWLAIAIFWLTLMTSFTILCKFIPEKISWICFGDKVTNTHKETPDNPAPEPERVSQPPPKIPEVPTQKTKNKKR